MTPITICLTYFRSLSLANLAASLYSVRRQDFSSINSLVVIDNNTEDSPKAIQELIDELVFPVPVYFSSFKHGDPSKTHAWSTNIAVRRAETSWIFFTRADYLLEVGALQQFVAVAAQQPDEWHGYITSYGFHLVQDIAQIEERRWRQDGLASFTQSGTMIDYSEVDCGVWCMPKDVFQYVGGLDERLTAWGHAQTHFQYRLHESGAQSICIPKILFYHPQHKAPRDLAVANQQIRDIGVTLQDMWRRRPGVYM